MALGPKPRSYRQRTPKKMVQLALHSALSDRASQGRVMVVDSWGLRAPKTKDAVSALRALGLDGQGAVLVVVDAGEVDRAHVFKSFANLPDVHVLVSSELNAYDVLCSDWVVFTRSTLPGVTTDDASGGPAGPAGDTAPTAGERDWDAPVASEERP